MQKNNYKVLIVDDVEENLRVIGNILGENGIAISIARNGKQAIKIAPVKLPDLILLDIAMPEMDGLEVCQILKNNELTKEIPIIFLTALARAKDIVKGFELGAIDYITKPFNKNELLSRVSTHLKLKRYKDTIEQQNSELAEKNGQLEQEITERIKAEKAVKDSEAKFRGLITGLDEVIFRISFPEGKYEYINPAVKKVFGYTEDDFYNNSFFINKIIHPEYANYFVEKSKELQSGKVSPILHYKIIDNKGRGKWIMQSNKATFNNGKVVLLEGIARDITGQKLAEEKLKGQNKELEDKNRNITSSINYAKVIQKAVLPSKDFFKQFFPENFIFYLPRDIVSGDFYWIKQISNYIIIAAADCTGHGVPGAFMSMLGTAYLNEICNNFDLQTEIKANEILNALRKRIKIALHQDRRKGTTSDGMDIALCIINLENNEAQYAGANNPLYLIRFDEETGKHKLHHYKPDKMPIAVYIKEKPFTNNKIQLKTNDLLYIFSDGFADQFGGKDNRTFRSNNFKELLLNNCHNTLAEQKEIIKKTFYKWKDKNEQIDDIVILGLKIHEAYGDIDFF